MKEQLAAFGVMAFKVFSPVLLALLGLGVMKLNAWIAAKVHNEKLAGALQRLDNAALDAVKSTQQAVVSALPDNPKPEDWTKVKDSAMADLKSHLGPRGIEELQKILGIDDPAALEKMLGAKIESKVHDLKVVEKGKDVLA